MSVHKLTRYVLWRVPTLCLAILRSTKGCFRTVIASVATYFCCFCGIVCGLSHVCHDDNSYSCGSPYIV